jgi:membrane protein
MMQDTSGHTGGVTGRLAWRAVTAGLFTVGKYLISLYIGSSNMASTYGAAGALIIVFVWVYYSAQILLLGAEFAKAYGDQRRTRR